MKSNCNCENYQDQNLKAMIVFANFLGPDTTFLISLITSGYYSIFKHQTKKHRYIDADKKWITTWNDYL
jgi:hypothetical protein